MRLHSTPLKQFDFQCPLMSLPYLFNTNIQNIPKINQYFKCDDEKVKSWRNILNLSKSKNIGIGISETNCFRIQKENRP